jgi:hypothetical protein
MFASFIYTECQSPGPYKTEPGFKFKDVEVFEFGDSGADTTRVEKVLNLAAASFLPYSAPDIDPFMTPQEFKSLEKQWALQEIEQDVFMFSRLFTSGVSNGRPGNPYFQGFVFDRSEVNAFVANTGQVSGLKFARPADFSSWDGWLTPRGDAELEESALEPDYPPTPMLDSAELCREAEALFDEDPDDSLQLLASFYEAVTVKKLLPVSASESVKFLGWVSLLSHLVPVQYGWAMQFSSSGANPLKSTTPKFAIIQSSEIVRRLPVLPWSELASLIIETGSLEQTLKAIGDLSLALDFDPTDGEQALSVLPIACMFIDPAGVAPADVVRFNDLLAQLVPDLVVPRAWVSMQASNAIFDRLESRQSLARLVSSGNDVHGLLSRISSLT